MIDQKGPPQPAGQDPEGASRARNGHSTALFAAKCQSFLDNVIAGLEQTGLWDDPILADGPGISAGPPKTGRGMLCPFTGSDRLEWRISTTWACSG
jgi:hypothetical protein